MENNYRNMMDEVRAPESLRESVLDMTERERTKKTRPAPVRALLAAACVCALLVMGVVAAEVMGFDFVHIFGEQEEESICYVIIGGDDGAGEPEERNMLYEVYGSGLMKNIPLRELSPALQELQGQYKEENWYREQRVFESWSEAEEYIGWELVNNTLLDQAEYEPSMYGSREQPQEGDCIVSAWFNYGKFESVNVRAKYRLPIPDAEVGEINSTTIEVNADFYIGDELPLNPNFGYINDAWTVEGQESYPTANGLESVIVTVKWKRGNGGQYHAFFFLRGIRFRIEASYWDGNEARILTGLKEVLDNFQ